MENEAMVSFIVGGGIWAVASVAVFVYMSARLKEVEDAKKWYQLYLRDAEEDIQAIKFFLGIEMKEGRTALRAEDMPAIKTAQIREEKEAIERDILQDKLDRLKNGTLMHQDVGLNAGCMGSVHSE